MSAKEGHDHLINQLSRASQKAIRILENNGLTARSGDGRGGARAGVLAERTKGISRSQATDAHPIRTPLSPPILAPSAPVLPGSDANPTFIFRGHGPVGPLDLLSLEEQADV